MTKTDSKDLPSQPPSPEEARIQLLEMAVERLVERVRRLEDTVRSGEAGTQSLTDIIRASKIGGGP